MKITQRIAVTTLTLGIAGSAFAANKRVHEDLTKLAKVSEPEARKIALARVSGEVESEELERDHHHIVYSYDIKQEGKPGFEEVQIDAITGKIVSVSHESDAAEKKEDKKEKR